MSPPPEADALARFRVALYATALGQRKDSPCDLLDAVLTAGAAETLARLSLAPGFRRGRASVSDALADGTLDVDALLALLVAALPTPLLPSPAPSTTPAATLAFPCPPREALRPL